MMHVRNNSAVVPKYIWNANNFLEQIDNYTSRFVFSLIYNVNNYIAMPSEMIYKIEYFKLYTQKMVLLINR